MAVAAAPPCQVRGDESLREGRPGRAQSATDLRLRPAAPPARHHAAAHPPAPRVGMRAQAIHPLESASSLPSTAAMDAAGRCCRRPSMPLPSSGQGMPPSQRSRWGRRRRGPNEVGEACREGWGRARRMREGDEDHPCCGTCPRGSSPARRLRCMTSPSPSRRRAASSLPLPSRRAARSAMTPLNVTPRSGPPSRGRAGAGAAGPPGAGGAGRRGSAAPAPRSPVSDAALSASPSSLASCTSRAVCPRSSLASALRGSSPSPKPGAGPACAPDRPGAAAAAGAPLALRGK
mmetsp:Transcript_18214/g.57119  ORF Transcript_18214/g.57119 Transcript_18214/m.57119 type:complete len:290 (+) Transcript_18214:143-1012(+)